MTPNRLSLVGRIVLGVVILLLLISLGLQYVHATGITPYLFLIAAVLVVGLVVFGLTRRVGGRR